MFVYSGGFLFSPDKSEVILIRKAKPSWMAGKLNGVGGKIEPGETPLCACVREFEEETGMYIPDPRWKHIRTEDYSEKHEHYPAIIYWFAAIAVKGEFDACATQEAEDIIKVRIADLLTWQREHALFNVPYLVLMAQALVDRPAIPKP